MNENYSVLMSVYEKENPKFLIASIESIMSQTHLTNDFIIVKDGILPDSLNEVLENYKLKYPEIINLICLNENIGLGLALNEGLKKAKNNLVARMDSDDISKPMRCEKQINEFLNNPKLSIVGSFVDEFTNDINDSKYSRAVPTNHEDIIKFSKRRNPFNHPTVMYKKEEIINAGGYRNFRRNQDLDLFVRMILNGYYTKNINESLLYFRANGDNLSRRKSFEKCSSYVKMVYSFNKAGHSSLFDVLSVLISQVIVYILPSNLFTLISKKILREKKR